MEQFTKEEVDEAIRLKDFYINLVEDNHQSLPYYLANNVVLDWFGRTVRNAKSISSFLQEKVGKVTHHFTNVIPAENVAFKDCHHVKISKEESISMVPLSPDPKYTTPPKSQTEASTSTTTELGQGDGIHNLLMSPRKKRKLVKEEVEEEGSETVESEMESSPKLKYITATGTIEFHRPSIKKLQTETKWHRPVKLHIGYTSNNFKDCTIYLIIYEGNVKCRRNLYKEFCESISSGYGSE